GAPKNAKARSAEADRAIWRCSASDAKRPAETGIGSRSLPSDPLNGASFFSAASPPTVPGQSDGEALQACPVVSRNPNAGWRGPEYPHVWPSYRLSLVLGNSFQYQAIPPQEVATPRAGKRLGG